MKNAALLFMVFSLSVQGLAQKMPSDYLSEAEKHEQAKNYEKAASSYRYIVDKHKNNALYPMAFFNLAYTYYQMGKTEVAVRYFKTILKGDFNDRDPVGGDIMSSPYANYRNQAASILSDIYYGQKKYDSSLHYLYLSDTVYTYQGFCGNAYATIEVINALRYADLYLKLGNQPMAISSLLKTVFLNDLTSNKEPLKKLEKIFKAQKRKDLKTALDAALQNLQPTDKFRWTFTFLGTEIAAPDLSMVDISIEVPEDEAHKKELLITLIKLSDFYEMIEKL